MNTEKAKLIVPFCGVVDRDGAGKVTKVFVPSSPTWEGTQRGKPRCSLVSLTRNGGLSVHCANCEVYGDGEPSPCKGMEAGHMCYHALAGVIVSATENRGQVFFFTSNQHEQANDFARQRSGRLIKVVAAYGNATCWMVYVAGERRVATAEKEHLQRRVEELEAQLRETKAPLPVCKKCSCLLDTADGLCPRCDVVQPEVLAPAPLAPVTGKPRRKKK